MSFDPTKYAQSKWLKGSDLNPDQYITVTVERAYEKEFEATKETKPILDFSDLEQSLILNRTQITAMIELFGPNPDAWIGQRINLSAAQSDYQNKPTILIEPGDPTFGGQSAPVDVPF